MDELQKPIDLELWLNEDLIHRQNFIKGQFIQILKSVGNAISPDELSIISSKSVGAKIARGNNLHGLPYQALDLIRDFDFLDGVNIRLLNWFGVGFFTTVLLGKSRKYLTSELLRQDYSLGLSEDKWDYPDLILNKNQTNDLAKIPDSDLDFFHWIKEVKIVSDPTANATHLTKEVKKILAILKHPS